MEKRRVPAFGASRFPGILPVLFLLLPCRAAAGPPYRPEEVEGLSSAKLSREARAFLLRNWFVYTGRKAQSLLEIYERNWDHPDFYTTDFVFSCFLGAAEKAWGEWSRARSWALAKLAGSPDSKWVRLPAGVVFSGEEKQGGLKR